MAKVVSSKVASRKVKILKPAWKIVLLGMASGLLYWSLTSLFVRGNYSLTIAGNISTILVAALGITAMLSMKIEQPIIIATATGVSLWGLSEMTDKLSTFEILLWTVGLYVLAYLLYYWITRYYKFWPVFIFTIIVVALSRLIVIL